MSTTSSLPSLILPVFNRVLVQLVKRETSLIEMPEGSISPDGFIVVLAIGPDVKSVEVGDHILIIPNANILGIDEKEHIAMIHDSSIIAIDRREVVGKN